MTPVVFEGRFLAVWCLSKRIDGPGLVEKICTESGPPCSQKQRQGDDWGCLAGAAAAVSHKSVWYGPRPTGIVGGSCVDSIKGSRQVLHRRFPYGALAQLAWLGILGILDWTVRIRKHTNYPEAEEPKGAADQVHAELRDSVTGQRLSENALW